MLVVHVKFMFRYIYITLFFTFHLMFFFFIILHCKQVYIQTSQEPQP